MSDEPFRGPYELDPFQQIIEIHFPRSGVLEYIAVSLSFRRHFDVWYEAGLATSPGRIYTPETVDLGGVADTDGLYNTGLSCTLDPVGYPDVPVPDGFMGFFAHTYTVDYSLGTKTYRRDGVLGWVTKKAQKKTPAQASWTSMGDATGLVGITNAMPASVKRTFDLANFQRPLSKPGTATIQESWPRGHWLPSVPAGTPFKDSNGLELYIPGFSTRRFSAAKTGTFQLVGDTITQDIACYRAPNFGSTGSPYNPTAVFRISLTANYTFESVPFTPGATFKFAKRDYDLVGTRPEADDPAYLTPGSLGDPPQEPYAAWYTPQFNGRLWCLYKLRPLKKK